MHPKYMKASGVDNISGILHDLLTYKKEGKYLLHFLKEMT